MYKSYASKLQDSKNDNEQGVGMIDNARILDDSHDDYDNTAGNREHDYIYLELIIRRPSGETMTCRLRWPEEWGEEYRVAKLLEYYGLEPEDFRDIEDRLIPIKLKRNRGHCHNVLDMDMEWWIDFDEINTTIDPSVVQVDE